MSTEPLFARKRKTGSVKWKTMCIKNKIEFMFMQLKGRSDKRDNRVTYATHMANTILVTNKTYMSDVTHEMNTTKSTRMLT